VARDDDLVSQLVKRASELEHLPDTAAASGASADRVVHECDLHGGQS
jgi:hypothetical protein